MKRENVVIAKRVSILVFFLLALFANVRVVDAQQFKVGKNLSNIKPGAVLELEDPNQALLLTRVFNPNVAIAIAYRGMIVFDSSVNKLSYFDGTTWQYPTTSTIDSSIYAYNGTLRGNRIVAKGANWLRFTGNSGDTVAFNNDGNMGIGTSSPVGKLEIVSGGGNTNGLVVRSNASWDALSIAHDGQTAYFNASGSDSGIAFRTNTLATGNAVTNTYTEQMRILPNGNVGIGVKSPISKLQVKGAVRTDSMVLVSNSLYKSFNTVMDSIAVIDSVGRVMKVGVQDILNASNPIINPIWTAAGTRWQPNISVGGITATYGFVSGSFQGSSETVTTANYISAKDTLVIVTDIYPGNNGGYNGGYYLKLYEYSDAVGTLVKTDTLATFVNVSSSATLPIQNGWNNGLVYGIKLNANTKYVKIEFLSNAYNASNSLGRGFKNIQIKNVVNSNSLNYVQGGNNFGTTGLLGLSDNNNLSIITNNTNRMWISNIGNIGIGNTSPISALQVKGAVRTDSMVLVSNKLYKTLNTVMDSVAIIDSVGRVMKVSVQDVLNASLPSSIANWQKIVSSHSAIVAGQLIGGQTTIYGVTSNYNDVANAGVIMSDYMYAKDSINVGYDIYTTNASKSYLRLHQYSDVIGTEIVLDTLVVFANGTSVSAGINSGLWTNNQTIGKLLLPNTKYIKLDFLITTNSPSNSNGFKNVSINTPTLNNNSLNYVQGGNSFGIPAILGTKDKQNLSIITNNTTALTIDTLNTIVLNKIKDDSISAIRVNYAGNTISNIYQGLMLSMSTTQATTKNGLSFYNPNQNRYMGLLWNQVGSAYNAPVIGISLYNGGSSNNGKLDQVWSIKRNDMIFGSADYGDENIAYNLLKGNRAWQMSMRTNSENNSLKFYYTPNGSSYTHVMTLDTSGKVGIGTANPARTLQVNSGGMVSDSLTLVGAASVLKIVKGVTGNASLLMEFYKNGTSISNYGNRAGYFGFGASGNNNFFLMNQLAGTLSIGTNNINAITLDTLGKVGIGTATPKQALETKGGILTDSLWLTSLEVDTNNYNAGLTIGVDGKVRLKSLANSYNTILQGIKSTGGNAFGDTVRIGSYDFQPMRLYASNSPGITINPKGTATYVPVDSSTVYLRNIAYDATSKMGVTKNTGETIAINVDIGSLSNVIDNSNSTYVQISQRSSAATPSIDVYLNALYYIDSIVLVTPIGPGGLGNATGLGRAGIILTNGATTVQNLNLGAPSYTANVPYGVKMAGVLANVVKVYNANTSTLFNFQISEIYIYGRRAKQVTNQVSETRINGLLAMDNVSVASANDSILTINTTTGVVGRKSINSNNIYTSDGSLAGNRVVTMGSNSLTFAQSTGTVNFTSTASSTDTAINILGNISGVGNNFSGIIVNSNAQWQTTGLKIGNTNVGNTATYELNVMGSGQNFGKLGIYSNKSGYNLIIDTLGRVSIGNNLAFALNAISALQVKGAVRADSLVLNSLNAGDLATDSILTINTSTGVVRRIAPTTIKPSTDSSIYAFDGTLAGNRALTMNNNSLTFNSGNGNFIFNPTGTGKMGIGNVSPTQKLSIGSLISTSTATPDAISLGGTFSNTAGSNLKLRLFETSTDVAGFGVSLGQIDYVGGTGIAHVFYNNGSEQMRISSSGNVGIGTSSPINKLHVEGTLRSVNLTLTGLATITSTTDELLTINTSTNVVRKFNMSGVPNIYNANGVLGGDRILSMSNNSLTFNSGNGNFIYNPTGTGKMGIGTSSPAQMLDIQKSGSDNYIRIQAGATSANNSGILLNEHNNDYGWRMRFDANTDNLYFEGVATGTVANIPLMMSRTSGNITLGNTPAVTALNTTDSIMILQSAGGGVIRKVPASAISTSNIYTADGTIPAGTTRNVTVSNKLRFIGTGQFFEINTAAAGQFAGISFLDGGTDKWLIEKNGGNNLAFTELGSGGTRMLIASGGNVGIGTSTPAQRLDVNGTSIFRGDINTSGALSFQLGGTLFFRANPVQIDQKLVTPRVEGISDVRLKKDISPIQGALAKVLQMKGVSYTWRKDMEKEAGYKFKEGKDYGVIAQELQKVLPELVQQDSKGFFTVDYMHITPVLIEAIKEQQAEIQSLKNHIQEFDNKSKQIDQLQNEVKELKAMMQKFIQK